MPLDKSGKKDAVGRNIAIELASGRPKAQAIAIALDTQRKSGGDVPPPPGEGPNMKSREAHSAAGKKLGKHMKDYSAKNVPTEEEVDEPAGEAVGAENTEQMAQQRRANASHMPPGKGK